MQKFSEFLYQTLIANTSLRKFLIAYSGGLDSHVLLHAMSQLRAKYSDLEITALHVNHAISPNAKIWSAHCGKICEELNIPLKINVIPSYLIPKKNIEARLRTIRYQILKENLNSDAVLLTAHNKNDQAETILLQLIRGSGVKGLSGMPMKKKIGGSILIRPLLNFTRADLAVYAQQNNLQWVEDESNQNLKFNRNYIRHDILPKLESRWSTVIHTLDRSAKLCSETEDLINEVAEQDISYVIDLKKQALNIAKLQQLSTFRQKNVLRKWLKNFVELSPGSVIIQKIQREIIHAREDAKPVMNFSNMQIRRYQNYLYLTKSNTAPKISSPNWDLQQPFILYEQNMRLIAVKKKGIGLLTANKLTNIAIRFRNPAERFHPHTRQGSHPLKKLFQEWKIPPWQRDQVPLLYVDNELAMVPNYGVAKKFVTRHEDEEGYEVVWEVLSSF